MKIATLTLLCAALSSGADMADLKRDCTENHTFASFRNCLIDTFTVRPVHLIAANVVPGGGTAVGLRYTRAFEGSWHPEFTAAAASSLRAFWFTEAKLTLTHRVLDGPQDIFGMHIYSKTRNLPQLPYYGLGPGVSTGARADYQMNDQRVGVDASFPLTDWVNIGGIFENLWTSVDPITDPDIHSIETRYNDVTAPGLLRQPTMRHSEVFIRPHFSGMPPYWLDYKIAYGFYHDTGTGEFSFRRFSADVRHQLYLERTGGQVNRDSVIDLRGYFSTATAGAGHRVPFYLQETIGGSDITGSSALRGFIDYRFRGPHVVLFQAEFSRRIWGPLGLMAFYDAGTVALLRSDLDLKNLKHSFGFGLTGWAAGKVVFKAYIGLGSGEGRHPYFGIPAGLI